MKTLCASKFLMDLKSSIYGVFSAFIWRGTPWIWAVFYFKTLGVTTSVKAVGYFISHLPDYWTFVLKTKEDSIDIFFLVPWANVEHNQTKGSLFSHSVMVPFHSLIIAISFSSTYIFAVLCWYSRKKRCTCEKSVLFLVGKIFFHRNDSLKQKPLSAFTDFHGCSW